MSKKVDHKQIEAARSELAHARSRLADIEAGEGDAINATAAFESWTAERGRASAEVVRLEKLEAQLNAALIEQTGIEENAAFLKCVEDQRRLNERLAKRIREDGRKATDILLSLLRDVATAEEVDRKLNAKLDDADRIVGADHLARFRPAIPKEIISKTKIDLWVFAETGAIVGAQLDVVERSDGSGVLKSGFGPKLCFKRKFHFVKYLEQTPAERQEPLSSMRLPRFDGPRWAWSGEANMSPRQVIANLSQVERGGDKERETLTEPVPIEPWTPPAESGVGGFSRSADGPRVRNPF